MRRNDWLLAALTALAVALLFGPGGHPAPGGPSGGVAAAAFAPVGSSPLFAASGIGPL